MAKKRKKKLTQQFKTPDRWLPNDTTRPQTFADRSKVANKNACRKGNYNYENYGSE